MKHPIQHMMDQRREGKICGIESVCSANGFVLEVALKRSKLFNAPVLIEATGQSGKPVWRLHRNVSERFL